MAFQTGTQLKDRQPIEGIARKSIEGVQNAKANCRAAAKPARPWNFLRTGKGKGKSPLPGVFEEHVCRFGRNRGKPRLFAAADGYMIVNAKSNPQTVKTRPQI